jgi:hypothetical protein
VRDCIRVTSPVCCFILAASVLGGWADVTTRLRVIREWAACRPAGDAYNQGGGPWPPPGAGNHSSGRVVAEDDG